MYCCKLPVSSPFICKIGLCLSISSSVLCIFHYLSNKTWVSFGLHSCSFCVFLIQFIWQIILYKLLRQQIFEIFLSLRNAVKDWCHLYAISKNFLQSNQSVPFPQQTNSACQLNWSPPPLHMSSSLTALTMRGPSVNSNYMISQK